MENMNQSNGAQETQFSNAQEIKKQPVVVMISVSADRMEAKMLVMEPEKDHQPITVEYLRAQLEEQAIVYGIKDDVLEQFVKNPVFDTPILVVEGKEATVGQDGQETFHFNLQRHEAPKEREDGTADYKDLHLIQNVRKNSKLYSWTKPTRGEDGQDIYGNLVEGILGQEIIVPQGENTEIDEERLTLIATSDGQVVYEQNKVHVKEVYVVNGDVDFSVGDIFFWGNVLIKGDVREGFKVIAEGDITIKGAVEAAQIRASGHVFIENGMNGMGTGKVNCDGNLTCKYIENCAIKTKSNIYADAILHSQLDCMGDIELRGRKGCLIGGECEIGGVLIGRSIGADNSPLLKITFKSQDLIPVNPEVEKQLKGLVDATDERQKKIDLYARLCQSGKLLLKKQQELAELYEKQKIELEEINNIKQQLAQEKLESDGKVRQLIKCSGQINEGVKINLDAMNYNVLDPMPFCTLYTDGKTIEVSYGRN